MKTDELEKYEHWDWYDDMIALAHPYLAVLKRVWEYAQVNKIGFSEEKNVVDFNKSARLKGDSILKSLEKANKKNDNEYAIVWQRLKQQSDIPDDENMFTNISSTLQFYESFERMLYHSNDVMKYRLYDEYDIESGEELESQINLSKKWLKKIDRVLKDMKDLDDEFKPLHKQLDHIKELSKPVREWNPADTDIYYIRDPFWSSDVLQKEKKKLREPFETPNYNSSTASDNMSTSVGGSGDPLGFIGGLSGGFGDIIDESVGYLDQFLSSGALMEPLEKAEQQILGIGFTLNQAEESASRFAFTISNDVEPAVNNLSMPTGEASKGAEEAGDQIAKSSEAMGDGLSNSGKEAKSFADELDNIAGIGHQIAGVLLNWNSISIPFFSFYNNTEEL